MAYKDKKKQAANARLRFHEGTVKVVKCPNGCKRVNGVNMVLGRGHWLICTVCNGTGGIKQRMK